MILLQKSSEPGHEMFKNSYVEGMQKVAFEKVAKKTSGKIP